LVSAPDASQAWDLRCKVREGLIAWLRLNAPENLPHVRADMNGSIDRGTSNVPVETSGGSDVNSLVQAH